MTKNVVVFGASGFIGTRLVAQQSKAGNKVVAIDILPPREKIPGVDYQIGDVRNLIAIDFNGPIDTLYNLAAVHRTPGHPAEEYYDTNIRGALNVTAFAEARGIQSILFTSSISVYGPNEEIIDELSPLRPTSDYGRSKSMAELIHRRWAQSGQDRKLVVVRPGVVFGPGERGNYTNLAGALKRGMFAYPGRRETIKSGGYVDELIRTFDFALSNPDTNITYNFAYPDASTTEDIVKTFGRVSGVKSSYPVIPVAPLLLVAKGFEVLNTYGLRNPIHRERIWKLVKSTRIAPSWLISHGYTFSTNVESALQAWFEETDGSFA